MFDLLMGWLTVISFKIDLRRPPCHDRLAWYHPRLLEYPAQWSCMVDRLLVHQRVLHKFQRIEYSESLEWYQHGNGCCQCRCNYWHNLPPGKMRNLSLGVFRCGDPCTWIVRRTVRGYRSALYLSMGMAAVALVICAFGVGMPKDTRQWRLGEDAAAICRGRMKELS